jgi:hypothetical protein
LEDDDKDSKMEIDVIVLEMSIKAGCLLIDRQDDPKHYNMQQVIAQFG